MKGNVFSGWLKEFCALVFTQTVQAFILAIILTLVITALFTNSSYTSVTQNQAAGVLAIIALTSISKMEDLIKKMFGLNSSLTDTSMKGGKGGMLGTVMALKMAKKVLDNGPKVAKGAYGLYSTRREKRKARLDALQRDANIYKRHNELNAADRQSNNPNDPNAPNNPNNPVNGNNTITGGATFNGGAPGTGGVGGPLNPNDVMNALYSAANAANAAANAANAAANSANNSNDKSDPKKNIKARHKLEDDLEKSKKEYEEKEKELNKKKRESIKQIASGFTETGGSILGAATGAVVGMAMGDDVIRNVGIGLGAGDVVGQKMVDIPYQLNELRIEHNKLSKKMSGYKKKMEDAQREYDYQKRIFDAGQID